MFPLSERTRILFSRDGRTVVSASDQGVVDVATGRRLLDLGTELPHPMALSANGVLADVARDNMLTLYEDQTYQRRTSAHIDIGAPRWMRFSPDGNILAIAETSSGRIQLWHVPSKSPYGPALTGFPRTEVQTLAFTPDGSTVLALDDEGRLRTHLIAPDRIKAALCAQFGPLSEADWKIHLPEIPYRKTC